MTNTEWLEATIADIAENSGVVGGPFGSELVRSDYVAHGVPVIRGVNLGFGERRFNADEFVYVSPEKADSLSRNLAAPGDIVVTQRGTLGQVGIVPSIGFERFVISQSQMRLRCNASKTIPEFVYYWLLLPEVAQYILSNAITTGVPHINLGFFRSLKICVPSLKEQREIVSIFEALDNKIELNRQMTQTMEELARALFKSWFIDFDPVHSKISGHGSSKIYSFATEQFPNRLEHDIPQDWRVVSLAEATGVGGAKFRQVLSEVSSMQVTMSMMESLS